MKTYIRSLAVTIAVLSSFVIAFLGTANDLRPHICAYRAVTGAVIIYCLATVSLKLAARIVISAIISDKAGIGSDKQS